MGGNWLLYLYANGKGDYPEVEIVLIHHLQRHVRQRHHLNSSFACSTFGSKVKEKSSTYYCDETIVGLCIRAKGFIQVRATSFNVDYLYAVSL